MKENFKYDVAFSFCQEDENLANEIVDPDLDIPGNIAIACPMPIIKAIR
jgi:hypothetical protein